MAWQSGGGGGYPGVTGDGSNGLNATGAVVAAGGLGNNQADRPNAAIPLTLDDGDGISIIEATVGAAGVGGGTIQLGNDGATSGTRTTIGTSSDLATDILLLLKNGDGTIGNIDAAGSFSLKHGLALFNHAVPTAQAVLATGAGNTVDNVITLLQSYGLCKQA